MVPLSCCGCGMLCEILASMTYGPAPSAMSQARKVWSSPLAAHFIKEQNLVTLKPEHMIVAMLVCS